MGDVRAISKRRWLRRPISRVSAAYIRLVYRTGDWRTINGDVPAWFWDHGKPFLAAFWHGRFLMMPCCWRKGVTNRVLVSEHGEGPLITDMISHFGLDTVRGSTTEGGATAVRAMVRAINQGACATITPDGPHGPPMQAAQGIISVARMSGVPIIPMSFSARHCLRLKGWDSLILPRPFTRGVHIWGRPIHVRRRASEFEIRTARAALEFQLRAITAQADRICGRTTPVAPELLPETWDLPAALEPLSDIWDRPVASDTAVAQEE